MGYPVGIADQATAMTMVIATLAALFAREQNGIGQEINISLLGSLVALEAAEIQSQAMRGFGSPRKDRSEAPNPLVNFYKCADGKWIVLSMYQADKYWHNLCNVLGIQDLENDSRFKYLSDRMQNAKELIEILDRVFISKIYAEWSTLLEESGLIYAPVQTISEVINDPQVLANNYLVDFEHSQCGNVKVVGFPFSFSETPLNRDFP
ncbi:CoA transferase, partial [Chloroflexota bacterium]